MAEFSKQWVELNDPEMGWDFDIDQITSELPKSTMIPYICEGFGFIAIGKDPNNNILLAIPTGVTETDENGQVFDAIVWEPYNNIIK